MFNAVLGGKAGSGISMFGLIGRCRQCVVACFAAAASSGLMAANPYEVNVPSGNRTLTSDDVAAMAGYDELVKTGSGTLVVGSVLSGFTGVIRIREGVYEVTESGALGTKVGATYVSSGASLRLNGATSGCIAFTNEVVHIAGTGASGCHGAVCNFGKMQASAFYKGTLALDDNATVYINSGSSRFDVRDGTLSMAGNTLTITNDHSGQSFSLTRVNVTGGGNMIVEKGIFQLEGRNAIYTWEGNANNTLTVKSGAFLQLSESTCAIPWTLNVKHGAYVRATKDGVVRDTINDWAGPVVFEGNVYGGYQSDMTVRFSGPVSGNGTYKWTGGWVALYNPTNTYTGTWQCANSQDVGGLVLNNTGSVTTAAQMIDMRGGSVLKLNASEPYDLPRLNFQGAKNLSVVGGCGRAASLAKSGASVLELGGSVCVTGVTEIAEGTIKIAGTVPFGKPGLWYGLHLCSGDGDDTFSKVWWGRTLFKDGGVTNSPFYAYHDTTDRMTVGSGSVATFSGYIWNRSNEAVTWTICAHVQTGIFVYLNNTKTTGSSTECAIMQNGDARKFANITLNPGYNLFEVRLYRASPYAPHCYPNQVDWPSKSGLMYAIGADKTEPAEFRRFEDPGDGSLFTCDLTPRSGLDASLCRATLDNLKLSGGMLDLNDREITAASKTLSGYGEITNGVFKLTEEWLITGASVQGGGLNFKDADFIFGENAVIRVDGMAKGSVTDVGLVVGTVTGGTVTGLSERLSADGRWIVRALGSEIRLFRREKGFLIMFR